MQDGRRRRGAAEDRGHLPSITEDAIGALLLSKLTAASVAGFRDRQVEKGLTAGTVVKRLNLLAAILNDAITNRRLPLRSNPAAAAAVI